MQDLGDSKGLGTGYELSQTSGGRSMPSSRFGEGSGQIKPDQPRIAGVLLTLRQTVPSSTLIPTE